MSRPTELTGFFGPQKIFAWEKKNGYNWNFFYTKGTLYIETLKEGITSVVMEKHDFEKQHETLLNTFVTISIIRIPIRETLIDFFANTPKK